MSYKSDMIEVRQTTTFRQWFDALRDNQAKDRIVARIRRMKLGNFGDAKFFDGLANCGSLMVRAIGSVSFGRVASWSCCSVVATRVRSAVTSNELKR